MGVGREGPLPVKGKVFFALLLCAVSPAAAAEEMDELRRDIRESHAVLEEMKASRERMEKSAPLAARAIGLLKTERYLEAERALAEWESADPEDSRLPALKELASKLKAEPDPVRQADLWNVYLSATLEKLQPKEKQNFVHRDH